MIDQASEAAQALCTRPLSVSEDVNPGADVAAEQIEPFGEQLIAAVAVKYSARFSCHGLAEPGEDTAGPWSSRASGAE